VLFISEESTFYADTRVIHRHNRSKWQINGQMYIVSSLEKKVIVAADGSTGVFGETSIFEEGEDGRISNEIFFMPVFVDSTGQQSMLLKELKQKD